MYQIDIGDVLPSSGPTGGKTIAWPPASLENDPMPHDFQQLTWDPRLEDDCRQIVRLAIREDLNQGYDWTTVALVPESGVGQAAIVAREGGVAAGLAAIPTILQETDANLQWTPHLNDSSVLLPGTQLGVLAGSARDLLTLERTILNLVGHLCGIASLTSRYVAATAGTSARIYDTRKTSLGHRRLEKYAVRCGGGYNHRTGLFDAVLIKDNHLAFGHLDAEQRFTPSRAVQAAREFIQETLPPGGLPMLVEIEVDSLDQFQEVLPAQPDIVLLDNMSCEQLATAVIMRNRMAPNLQLEASGGVNLQTLPSIARTGVDRISVGALTHSARCLDIGLDWHR